MNLFSLNVKISLTSFYVSVKCIFAMKHTTDQKQQQPLNIPESRQFVTVPEIARVLGRGEGGVRALFVKGQLPGKRIGGRWLMHRDDFARLIQPPHSSDQAA